MAKKWVDILPGTSSKSFTLDEIRKSKFGEYFDHLQQTLEKYDVDNSLLKSINSILSVEYKSGNLITVLNDILKIVPDFGFQTRRLVLLRSPIQGNEVLSACVAENHIDYDYLDNQLIDILDKNPRLFINDTSKIHTLKFQPYKKVPKTVLGYSLEIREGWRGILWFADANEVSLTRDQADGLDSVKDAVCHHINQAINYARISDQSELFKLAFEHLPYPSCILMGGNILIINKLADNLLQTHKISIDEMRASIKAWIDEEKTHTMIADHHFQLYLKKIGDFDNISALVFLVDDQQFENQRRYLDSAAQAIAHSIQTPLKNILGYSQAIPLLSDLNDSQQNYLNQIEKESDKCLTFSNSLLEMTKFSGDRLLMVEEVLINNVVDQLLEASKHLFRQKRVAVEQEFEPLIQPVIIDQQLFSQAVYLVIEFILERLDPGKKIKITFCNENEENSLRLSDNGNGFSEVDLVSLNQEIPESSIDSRIRTAGGIMRLHGGKLIIISELGKGSEFHLDWPMIRINASQAE